MALIHGIPMIGHCYFRVRMCSDLIGTYVATCDREIYNYIESIGGRAVMTSATHERASDRTAEAMVKIEEEIGEETIWMEGWEDGRSHLIQVLGNDKGRINDFYLVYACISTSLFSNRDTTRFGAGNRCSM